MTSAAPSEPRSGASGQLGPILAIGYAVFAALMWWRNAPAYVADDSYFYLVTARRLATEGRQTFSGPFLTNGMHPIWLYLLTGYDCLVALARPELLRSARTPVPLAGAIYIGSAFLLVSACRRAGWRPGIVATPVIVYVGTLGVLYSEVHVLLCCAALLLWWLAGHPFDSVKSAILTGLCCGAVFLARLDSVFWCGSLLGLAWAGEGASRRRVLLAGAVMAGLALPYLLSNKIVFGGVAPISGWMKSSFPVPNPSGFSHPNGISVLLSGYNVLFGWGPVLLGAATLAFVPAARRSLTFKSLLAGCTLHLTYTTLFAAESSWFWYYALHIILAGLSACFLTRSAPRVLAPAVATLCCLGGLAYHLSGRSTEFDPRSVEAIQFLQDNASAGQTALVSEAPGQTAFYTDANIVANDFLTASRFVYQDLISTPNALKSLLSLCQGAGYPISYVIWDGGGFFRVSQDRRSLIWLDPKNGDRTQPIGTLALPAPVVSEPEFAVWRLRDVQGPARSGNQRPE